MAHTSKTKSKNDLPIGLMGEPDHVVRQYHKLIASGESPRMAEMLATRKAAGLKTDSTYFAGSKRLGDVWNQGDTKQIVKAARKHGFNPTGNEVYNPTIARFRGDPRAFISHSDGRDAVKKHCREHGISVPEEGIYNEPKPCKIPRRQVAPDIVRNEIKEQLKAGNVSKPMDMIERAIKEKSIRKRKVTI